ncbi:MAG: exodeoxyribonuclease III [Gemmiger sp.]|nr:exodeoxyribonuclease III [Gemmiger sp.]
MKLISWNVNGLRACLKKDFAAQFAALNADAFCVQETKMQPGQAEFAPAGYHEYLFSAEKKGYSGTAIWTKEKPLNCTYGIGAVLHSHEGRAITLEYPGFYLVNVYVPNAQEGLARIDYRLQWEADLRAYLLGLAATKPVVLCGDLNVAATEIDLKNPKANEGHAGYSEQERAAFKTMLDAGFTDSFRYLYPDVTGAYTWWSYRFHARENNAGWRIDYFLVSNTLKDKIKGATIHNEIYGSDHCPIELELEV